MVTARTNPEARTLSACLVMGVVLALAMASHAKAPLLRVRVQSAKAKYAVSDEVKLKPVVIWGGAKAKFSYLWSVVKGPPLAIKDAKAKVLLIPKGELRSGATYKLQVEVTATYEDKKKKRTRQVKGSGQTSIVVNSPPHGGKCQLEGTSIGKDRVSMLLSAPGWKDGGPLQYSFELFANGKSVKKRGWSGANRARVNIKIAAGDQLQAVCHIRDRMGAEVKHSSVTLHP